MSEIHTQTVSRSVVTNIIQTYTLTIKLCQFAIKNSQQIALTYAQFVERNIWNPLVYVADMLKKLSGSEQLYHVNVEILLM